MTRSPERMLTDPLFAAFLSFTLVFVATPGATTAVVVRNALDGGRRAGLFAAAGAGGRQRHPCSAGPGSAARRCSPPGPGR